VYSPVCDLSVFALDIQFSPREMAELIVIPLGGMIWVQIAPWNEHFGQVLGEMCRPIAHLKHREMQCSLCVNTPDVCMCRGSVSSCQVTFNTLDICLELVVFVGLL